MCCDSNSYPVFQSLFKTLRTVHSSGRTYFVVRTYLWKRASLPSYLYYFHDLFVRFLELTIVYTLVLKLIRTIMHSIVHVRVHVPVLTPVLTHEHALRTYSGLSGTWTKASYSV